MIYDDTYLQMYHAKQKRCHKYMWSSPLCLGSIMSLSIPRSNPTWILPHPILDVSSENHYLLKGKDYYMILLYRYNMRSSRDVTIICRPVHQLLLLVQIDCCKQLSWFMWITSVAQCAHDCAQRLLSFLSSLICIPFCKEISLTTK